MRDSITLRTAMTAAILFGAGARAQADIVSTFGAVQEIAPPDSVREGDLTSNDYIRAFAEQSCVTLGAEIMVDAWAPGAYGELSGELEIPEGSVVNSYLLHYDQTRLLGSSANGGIAFDEEILGVIVRNGIGNWHLRDSDTLGAPGTDYPHALADRGLELGGADAFLIFPDLQTIGVNFSTLAGVDQMRVITRCVPEPASIVLLALGGLMTIRRLF